MKITTFPTAFTVALLFVASQFAFAQPDSNRPDAPVEGRGMPRLQPGQGGQSGGPGGFRGGQGQGVPMMELVLTEDQRDSLRQAMESQREKMRELQEKIRDARKVLMNAALADEFKDDVVRAKAMAVAKLEADVAVLRLKALSEVQPALSKEQLEKIVNQPPQGMGGDGQRSNNRRANRPPASGEMPQLPKRDPQ